MKLSSETTGKVMKYLPEVQAIFDEETGVKTIGDLVKRVEELSVKYQSDDPKDETLNVFKGDMLEVFAEYFFGHFENDVRVGLRNYTPVPLSDDYGVDGVGENANGDKCVVQVKYRANPLDVIKYEDLAKTYASGRIRLGCPLEKDDTIFLLTTGVGVFGSVKEVLGNRVRVIHRDVIAGYVDGNVGFWKGCNDVLCEALMERGLTDSGAN